SRGDDVAPQGTPLLDLPTAAMLLSSVAIAADLALRGVAAHPPAARPLSVWLAPAPARDAESRAESMSSPEGTPRAHPWHARLVADYAEAIRGFCRRAC